MPNFSPFGWLVAGLLIIAILYNAARGNLFLAGLAVAVLVLLLLTEDS